MTSNNTEENDNSPLNGTLQIQQKSAGSPNVKRETPWIVSLGYERQYQSGGCFDSEIMY
jgi:hypothetical protein